MIRFNKKKGQQDDIILLFNTTYKSLAAEMVTLGTILLKNRNKRISLNVYELDCGLAVQGEWFTSDASFPFIRGEIREDAAYDKDGRRFNIRRTMPGLDIISFLGLISERRKLPYQNHRSLEILVLFWTQDALHESLHHLIATGCDTRISWAKTRIDRDDVYLLLTPAMPLPELLRLMDNGEPIGELPSSGTGRTPKVFRRIGDNTKHASFFVPYEKNYPALEALAPKLHVEGLHLYDGNQIYRLPEQDQFIGIYDHDALFNPVIDSRLLPVLPLLNWEPICITLHLNRQFRRNQVNTKASTLWLLNVTHLDMLRKQLFVTPEDALNDFDAAMVQVENITWLVLRCRVQPERHHAMLSDLAEVFIEWLAGNNGTVIYLPEGQSLSPSLRQESYINTLCISGLHQEIVILRPHKESVELLHFPERLFRPFRSACVRYEATLRNKELSSMVTGTVLDHETFEVLNTPGKGFDGQESFHVFSEGHWGLDQSFPMNNRPSRDDGYLSIEQDKSLTTDRVLTEPTTSPVTTELEALVEKAKSKIYITSKNWPVGLLSGKEWQRLFQLTILSHRELITSIPSPLFSLIFAGGDDLLLLPKKRLLEDENLTARFREACAAADLVLSDNREGAEYYFNKAIRPGSRDGQFKQSQKLIEQALLLASLTPAEQKAASQVLETLLSIPVPRYLKLLILIHRLYKTSWQELIQRIIADYEGTDIKLWEELYHMHTVNSILCKEDEAMLAAKLVFELEEQAALEFLTIRSKNTITPDAYDLSTFLKTDILLTEKILALHIHSCKQPGTAGDTLAMNMTALNEMVKECDDLRFQWLYAIAVYRLNGDSHLLIEVRERIIERLQKREIDGLIPIVIRQALAYRLHASREELAVALTDLFTGQDDILAYWIKLIDAWHLAIEEPVALGIAPDCGIIFDCRSCPVRINGQDSVLCRFKQRIFGSDDRHNSNSGLPVALFKSFYEIIRRTALGEYTLPNPIKTDATATISDTADENNVSNDGTEVLTTFLLKTLKQKNKTPENPISPLDQIDWFHDQERGDQGVSLLLEPVPDRESLRMLIPELETLSMQNELKRLGIFLDYFMQWRAAGCEELINKVFNRIKAVRAGFPEDQLDPIQARFFTVIGKSLVSLGHTSDAVENAELFFKHNVNLPSESLARLIAQLLSQLVRLSPAEKAVHRERLKNMLQQATFFKNNIIDFSICSQGRLEVLFAIWNIFRQTGTEEEKEELDRLIAVERSRLLRRIRRDIRNVFK